jgi:hypothetical protein
MVNVSKLWHGAAVISLVGSLVGVGAASSPVSASTGPTVSISARSLLPRVTGDVLVFYKTGKYGNATISGDVTNAVAGDVVKLLAQPFPFRKPAAPTGKPLTLSTAGTVPYSFTVTPLIATRYQVEVLASGSSTPVKSTVQLVYITNGGRVTGGRTCARPVCSEKFRVYQTFPPSALRRESTKHWYVYLGLRLTTGRGIPPAPKWLYLDKKATVTKAKRIAADEFERTVRFSFRIGNDGYHWLWNVCAKDVEAKDGVGLPGHHSCGVRRIRSNVFYLG